MRVNFLKALEYLVQEPSNYEGADGIVNFDSREHAAAMAAFYRPYDMLRHARSATNGFDPELMSSALEVFKSESMLNKKDVAVWLESESKRFQELKDNYREQLAIEVPREVWEEAAKQRGRSAILWSIFAAFASVFLLSGGAIGLRELYISDLPELPLLTRSFVVISVITFSLYIIRIFVKLAISNSHLALAYKQKSAMTHFYLSLLTREDSAIGDNERALILSALFSSVETGLTKHAENKESEFLTAFALKKA